MFWKRFFLGVQAGYSDCLWLLWNRPILDEDLALVILRCIGVLWKVDTPLCLCGVFLSSVEILRTMVDPVARNCDVKMSTVKLLIKTKKTKENFAIMFSIFWCQIIKVIQRMLDLFWKYETNLFCKFVSRTLKTLKWWEPWISYDSFPRTLKSFKKKLLWISWNLPSRK